MPPHGDRSHALPGRLDADEPHRRLADEPTEQPDGVGAAADAGDGDVRQPPLDPAQLGRRLVADDPLQVADQRGYGCGPTAEPST